MPKTSMLLALAATSLVVLLQAAPAHAQASRTWVSGVGDDANPCSRTAPCKTFAGAISKTAGGGEINVLDPGGFGAGDTNLGLGRRRRRQSVQPHGTLQDLSGRDLKDRRRR